MRVELPHMNERVWQGGRREGERTGVREIMSVLNTIRRGELGEPNLVMVAHQSRPSQPASGCGLQRWRSLGPSEPVRG